MKYIQSLILLSCCVFLLKCETTSDWEQRAKVALGHGNTLDAISAYDQVLSICHF